MKKTVPNRIISNHGQCPLDNPTLRTVYVKKEIKINLVIIVKHLEHLFFLKFI